jgi:DNA-directed RNA polymerase subunit RPC12/RpoP
MWNDTFGFWYCMTCGRQALNNHLGESVDSNYCPYCGKKMVGWKKMGEEQIGG